ncbi:MAG: Asp/Glu racemase [Planctomycetes bacterium]|nr:Asp/Glu racemase [Planctomycetota bacterium]
MKTSVSCIHTSPAAISPIAEFFAREAPGIQITNLLDDGLLRLLSRGDQAAVERRLSEMLCVAQEEYSAAAVLLTCSAIPAEILSRLRLQVPLPIVKVDEPMAEAAVRTGRRIGVVISFAATCEPTERLLRKTAEAAGVEIEIVKRVVPAAYEALLTGRTDEHDRLLIDAVEQLAGEGAACIVLAQVSMARLLPKLAGRTKVPVLSSLSTCLQAIEQRLAISTSSPGKALP